jgi:hypothetical protein
VQLSSYQIAGFETAVAPTATLHADMVRRSDAPKVMRFGGRAHLHQTDIRKFPLASQHKSRRLAQIRATLMSPSVKLFITTSSSTFVFILGFLS